MSGRLDSGDGGANYSVIGDDGRIDWRRLGTVLIGVILIPIFEGMASLIETLFSISLIQPLRNLTQAISDGVGSFGSTLVGSASLSFTEADAFVASLGPLGFGVALFLVLSMAYLAVRIGGDDG
jgi:hypothetical protein